MEEKEAKEENWENLEVPYIRVTYVIIKHNHYFKQHAIVKHEGFRYSCDLCDTSFGDENNLKRHKKNVHDGVKYPCN